MSILTRITGMPGTITPAQPTSPSLGRHSATIRWLVLGAITLGCAITLRRAYIWPGVPLLILVIAAYVALVHWQYAGWRAPGGTLRLEPWRFTALSILLVFAMVVAADPATHGESFWYNIMYFVVLGESRHVPTARAAVSLYFFSVALTHLSVVLLAPNSEWLLVTTGQILPLDAGLAASAIGARLQRNQEAEHAARLALVEELAQSQTQLEEVNHQLQIYAGTVEQLAVANERNRLARDLHDILGYSLATVVVKAEAAKRLIAGDPARAREELDRVQEIARTGLTEVRRSVAGLRDAAVAAGIWHLAMTRFVEDFGRENGLQTTCEIAPLPEEHDPALEMCLFRVIQESLTNVARHAQASHVSVTLRVDGDQAQLCIEDNGVGAGPADSARAGYGLRGMRERVDQLGGRLVFTSKRREGTRVQANVPVCRGDAGTLGILGEAHAEMIKTMRLDRTTAMPDVVPATVVDEAC